MWSSEIPMANAGIPPPNFEAVVAEESSSDSKTAFGSQHRIKKYLPMAVDPLSLSQSAC